MPLGLVSAQPMNQREQWFVEHVASFRLKDRPGPAPPPHRQPVRKSVRSSWVETNSTTSVPRASIWSARSASSPWHDRRRCQRARRRVTVRASTLYESSGVDGDPFLVATDWTEAEGGVEPLGLRSRLERGGRRRAKKRPRRRTRGRRRHQQTRAVRRALRPGRAGVRQSRRPRQQRRRRPADPIAEASDEQIGAVVAYVASDDARWITGQNIRVNGGTV